MKKPLVIANWKMNLDLKDRLQLAQKYHTELGRLKKVEVVICPSFLSLVSVGQAVKASNLKIGAQDVFWEETGAYTGEESPELLRDLDCQYVILGHSERRQHLGETNEMVNKKAIACLDNDLTPIICVGETLADRQLNETYNVVFSQLDQALANLDMVNTDQLVIAYEPVWAIGTGQVANPDLVEPVLELIEQVLVDHFPLTIVKNNVRLVYGGSVDAENVGQFSQLDLVNGFLVGGASLDIAEFKKIVKQLY